MSLSGLLFGLGLALGPSMANAIFLRLWGLFLIVQSQFCTNHPSAWKTIAFKSTEKYLQSKFSTENVPRIPLNIETKEVHSTSTQENFFVSSVRKLYVYLTLDLVKNVRYTTSPLDHSKLLQLSRVAQFLLTGTPLFHYSDYTHDIRC